MSIYSVLRHRCRVERYTEGSQDGMPTFEWATVATNVPVLLDAQSGDLVATYTVVQQRTADRTGKLIAAPGSPVQPGDRVTGTRGFAGRFLVKPDPAAISTLTGVSHHEFRVEEVPS